MYMLCMVESGNGASKWAEMLMAMFGWDNLVLFQCVNEIPICGVQKRFVMFTPSQKKAGTTAA